MADDYILRSIQPSIRMTKNVLVRVTEGLIGAGVLSMWAGMMHYHLVNRDPVIPSEFPPHHRAVKAMIAIQAPMEDASFYLVVLGVSISAAMGFLALIILDSKQKPNFFGLFASFAITISSWHLFRQESKDTLEKYLQDPVRSDLWAPITSNLVLLLMAMLLTQHNLFKIWLFRHLPLTGRLVCRITVVVGVVCAQIYFSVMLLLSFTAGIVLLATSPFLILFGYVGGQVWEHFHMQAEASEEEKQPLTNITIPQPEDDIDNRNP